MVQFIRRWPLLSRTYATVFIVLYLLSRKAALQTISVETANHTDKLSGSVCTLKMLKGENKQWRSWPAGLKTGQLRRQELCFIALTLRTLFKFKGCDLKGRNRFLKHTHTPAHNYSA